MPYPRFSTPVLYNCHAVCDRKMKQRKEQPRMMRAHLGLYDFSTCHPHKRETRRKCISGAKDLGSLRHGSRPVAPRWCGRPAQGIGSGPIWEAGAAGPTRVVETLTGNGAAISEITPGPRQGMGRILLPVNPTSPTPLCPASPAAPMARPATSRDSL